LQIGGSAGTDRHCEHPMTETMRRKRLLSAHEKQIRFFTIFFGAMLVMVVVVLLWAINRLPVRAG
jgi:hypothetical protein